MSTAFTPAPWVIDWPQEPNDDLHITAQKWVSGDRNNIVMMKASGTFKNGEEGKANARLIAAAPELFEALQFCQSVIKSQGMFDRSEQLAYEKASSAIAKATGEKEQSK